MRRRDFCLALGGAVLLQPFATAQEEGGFSALIYRSTRGQTMPYRLFVPEAYRKGNRYPLVVWLHGGAGRGSDNLKQITGGNISGSRVWTKPENQSGFPCFVVAPQCADEQLWATLEKAEPTGQLLIALELIKDLQRGFSIDDGRIYVAGQSLGGFGAWSLITAYPRRFAAAVPLCGGGDESKARQLVREHVWAFHGEIDASVSVERSRTMIAAIRRAGGSPRYTEYKGEGHVIWEKAFKAPELLPWVFAQRA
jgi:predicted peptidase